MITISCAYNGLHNFFLDFSVWYIATQSFQNFLRICLIFCLIPSVLITNCSTVMDWMFTLNFLCFGKAQIDCLCHVLCLPLLQYSHPCLQPITFLLKACQPVLTFDFCFCCRIHPATFNNHCRELCLINTLYWDHPTF